MADEGTNLKLQEALDALQEEERQIVNSVWSNFSSSSHPRRALILQGLLTMCCFSQLSLLTEQLNQLIRIDPFAIFPREVSLKILSYLDATSLCRAAQVTRRWKMLADDDILWRVICEQHIGQLCTVCGWRLPVLDNNHAYRSRSTSPPLDGSPSSSPPPPISYKRSGEESSRPSRPPKRSRTETDNCRISTELPTSESLTSDIESSSSLIVPGLTEPQTRDSVTRPWKDVYRQRMTVEWNWRRGRYTMRVLKGHTGRVMCLQFNENLSHPAFPVLISGSYDRTVRVWNLETGAELHCLRGHTRAIRCLQFDEAKLITGSMDSTIKVWDWRRGKCIRTLAGHTEGVVCLNFDSNLLASGSVDSTVRVWNIRSGGFLVLRGHSDWVNAVQLWDSGSYKSADNSQQLDPQHVLRPFAPNSASPIDPGKMLFSASDDGTIKLWDLNLRTCIRQFTGHVAQVQSLKLLLAEECGESGQESGEPDTVNVCTTNVRQRQSIHRERGKPLLVSGSLDNTIKIWDVDSDSDKAIRTFFGHIEGVWSVACDKLRVASGSHDKTIKVWSRDEGRCTVTLVGHQAAVSCVALGEDKIVSGSDDKDVRIWSFSD